MLQNRAAHPRLLKSPAGKQKPGDGRKKKRQWLEEKPDDGRKKNQQWVKEKPGDGRKKP
jgi:hypothetical protein